MEREKNLDAVPNSQVVEYLPFKVRVATGAQDLAKVVEIRAKAYARHLPHFAHSLRHPEADDHRADAILLLAERKLDGAPLGSSRLLPNVGRPLSADVDPCLPETLRSCRLLESARLGAEEGEAGKLVTAALSKATYLVCRKLDLQYGIAVARRSAVAFFQRMGYDVVAGPLRFNDVPVPLWMVAMPTAEFETRLEVRSHPYYGFVAQTVHPDIDISLAQLLPELQTA